MRVPVRLVRGGWPAFVESALARFVRADPRAVVDGTDDAALFRDVMSYLHVGRTIKITGVRRHPEVDALVLDNLDTNGLTVVDIGASDGSSSLELFDLLGNAGAFVIADLYLTVTVVRTSRHVVFLDRGGEMVLVAGRRLVAWPALSRLVRLLYRPVLGAARRHSSQPHDVLLINPDVRARAAADDRLSWREHDVFAPWQGPSPDLIKVANLLRRMYFDDATILQALRMLHSSLPEGGHLLIADNSRIPDMPARGALYNRAAHTFDLVAATTNEPEIADLVAAVDIR